MRLKRSKSGREFERELAAVRAELTAVRAELAQLSENSIRATPDAGVVVGACAHCDVGWVVRRGDLLTCDACGHTSSL